MQKLLAGLRPYLAFAGLFSLVLNLLLLAPSLYMLQVFDRVLTSRSNETLVVLSLAVLIALLTMAALDVTRAYVLAAVGAALDRMLGPKVLEGLLGEASRLGGRDHAHALRDVHCVRTFFSGAGILALFDAVTMLTLAFFNERMTHAPLERAQTEGRKAARFIDLSLRNAEVVNALGMLPAVTRRWSELNERALDEQAGATRAGAALSG